MKSLIVITSILLAFVHSPLQAQRWDEMEQVQIAGERVMKEGNCAEAVKHFEKLRTIAAQDVGKAHIYYGRTLIMLGRAYTCVQKSEQSETCLLEGLSILEKVSGKNSLAYFEALAELSYLYFFTKKLEKSLPITKELVALSQDGMNPRFYIRSLADLARNYRGLNKYEESVATFKKALTVFERKIAKKDLQYAEILLDLGTTYQWMKQVESSKNLLLTSIEIIEEYNGKSYPIYRDVTERLGVCYAEMRQFDSAKLVLKTAMLLYEKAQDYSQGYFYTLDNLTTVFIDTEEYKAANIQAEKMEAMAKNLWGTNDLRYARTLFLLGSVNQGLKEYAFAEKLYSKAENIHQSLQDTNSIAYSTILYHLGDAYFGLEQYTKAENVCQRGIEITGKLEGIESVSYAMKVLLLPVTQMYLQKFDAAEQNYLKALAILEKKVGKSHKDYQAVKQLLIDLYTERGEQEKIDAMKN